MGKEYLVEGAQLKCVHGSRVTGLKVPGGHGYTSGGKKKANVLDCRKGVNIRCFGQCAKNEKTHQCEGYMLLANTWESISASPTKPEMVNGYPALTMDSVLLCKRGGIIMPITSGQGYERGVNHGAFMARFQNMLKWVAGKKLWCQIFGGDPINLNTGNFIYEKEDLKMGGITELSFRLFYNAMEESRGGCLGQGWHHNQETHIRLGDKGMVHLCLGDGREIPYRKGMGRLYNPLFGDGGLLWQEKDGYRYRTDTGEEYAFNGEGLLQSKRDPRGNTDTYFYNEKGQLIWVKGAGGGEIFYRYNEEGNLIRVKDHTGREVQLWYRYGKLYKYVNACGHTYTYAYNVNGRLESVLPPRGIVGVKNTYDGANRVVKQEMPNGGVLELEYDDENNRTYVTEPGGRRIIYESDERFRNIRTIYEDGEEQYAYNERNQRTLFVDKLGNKTRYRYDEKGNLTQVINALGEKTSFIYDDQSRLLRVEAGGRVVRSHTYDEAGRLVSLRDALGRRREAVYDERGLLKEVIQADGSRISFLRDERGNVTQLVNPYGEKIEYTYDALNRLTGVKDGEGNTTVYTYDAANRILSMTNPEGNTTTFRYNESGKVVEIQDFDGERISYTYQKTGKLVSVTDKAGQLWKRSYDRQGNLVEEITPTGVVCTLQYDVHNRLVRKEEQDRGSEGTARVVEWAYDLAENLVEVRAGEGKEILKKKTYTYDALNRVTTVTNQAGGVTHYRYSPANGKVESITDAMGNTRQFFYNEAGELIQEEDGFGNQNRYGYTLLGKLSHKTDIAGRRISYTYLPGGRVKRIETGTGGEVVFSYDALGRVKEREEKHRGKTTYAYDVMGRIVGVTKPGGQRSSYAYDALGQVTSLTDGKGNRTTYAYTPTGKLKEVVDALGNPTIYRYDERDFLTEICQQGQEEERITRYTHNAFGEVTGIGDALGHREQYTYDGLGRVVEKVDQEGFATRYAYNPLGRVEHILYGDGKEVSYAYDSLGQLERMEDWLGVTTIERNAQGRPVRITDHKGRSVGYAWGEQGEPKEMAYPDGATIRWEYDELLRPIRWRRTAQGKPEIQVEYGYDEAGRLILKKSSGGYLTRWTYGACGELMSLTHEGRSGILEEYSYDYDELGNKTSIRKKRAGLPLESGEYGYTYDGLQRLIQVTKDGQLLRDYTYDGFGNRIRMEDKEKGRVSSYHYNAMNQLIREEMYPLETGDGIPGIDQEEKLPARAEGFVKQYTYDPRGNLVEEMGQEGKVLHGYAYDARNRLERAWNDKGEEAVYRYNGMGQRVEKRSSTEPEEYLLDLTRPYHNLLGIQREKERESFYWDFTTIATEKKGSSPRYYLLDELGSPLRVQYATGKGECYGYDEFGQDLAKENSPALKGEFAERYTRQGTSQPFGYTGYRYDGISGSYFAQAREYQPHTGRFMAEDVIRGKLGVPKTLNRYGYCWGNPTTLVEIDGNFPSLSDIEKGMRDATNAVQDTISDVAEVVVNVASNLKETGTEFYHQSIYNFKKVWNQGIDYLILFEKVNNELSYRSTEMKTHGFSLSVSGAYGVSGSKSLGVVKDYNGNIAIQETSTIGGGIPSVGITASIMTSKAPTYENLEGYGGVVGGSVAFNLAVGYDAFFMDKYVAHAVSVGVGYNAPWTGFAEGHGEVSYTKTLKVFNIYEILETLKFREAEGCLQ